jgi:hypothetical protein
VTVRNIGSASARGVSVCPKFARQLKPENCRRVANLAAGRSATFRFTLRVKAKAGRKVKGAFVVSATDLESLRRPVTVKVTRAAGKRSAR